MQGVSRYWTLPIKKFIKELSQAESEKDSKLKSILQRLIIRFCEHHDKWRQLVSTTAELDVLISLAIASDYYEGPTCQPTISGLSNLDEVPHLPARSLGYPVLRSDSLGKGTFVSNDVNIGGPDWASFIQLTGPNMGGKSTFLRQVCLAVILAQVGAYVPAESFNMSPVDCIFVRMGAKDHIVAGQIGTNVGDIGLWEVGSRERLVLKNFKVWDLSACSVPLQAALVKDPGVSVNRIDAHIGGVNDLAFSHPNKQLCVITCGDDKTIKVWDATTGAKQN
ncbi:hypothetical protein POM88_035987 [Heracleum sosnowskyi]|uniref:DNA mismatch repair proteins mutS family domain-containing protein n=1 Tax=Heracleum sosnowskyi TaxID=360622 RepID=A0AAD8HPN8_9APIA|nr:hypothetical protein POM88_035987 [Heracleum sosnowskyi]